MNERVIIVCESIYHGNTFKLAASMAKRLECKVIDFEEALKNDLSSYEVIGLGSGIYFTEHHPKLMRVAEKLNDQQKAFVFSTRGNPKLGKYHQALTQKLHNQGVKICGEFSTKGYDRTGPFVIFNGGNKGRPHEADLMKAEKFIMNILPEYVYKTHEIPKGRNVFVHESCIGCKKCIEVCPMYVFEMNNHKATVVNERDCTHCSLCVENCNQHAISIHHTKKELIQIAIRHKDKKGLSVGD